MITEPLYARLLVKRLEARGQAACGAQGTDEALFEPHEGRVIAKDRASCWGPGVALGDRISFAEDAGDELQIDGQAHLILCENEVLAVLG
jgi:co-chaperonin GroES (HSP10)